MVILRGNFQSHHTKQAAIDGYDSPLTRVVVIEVVDDLHSDVSFTRARRSHDHGEAGLHARSYRLHLARRKGDPISRFYSR